MNNSVGTFSFSTLRRIFLAVLLLTALSLQSSPASAYIYTGGDWGGGDLTLLDGDLLSGDFFNIGSLLISSGVTVLGEGGDLSLSAGSVLIEGALFGNPLQPGKLALTSSTWLMMNGSLSSWQEITLKSEGFMVLNGTVFLPSDQPVTQMRIGDDGLSSSSGGTLTLTPVPLPSAAFLMAPGLAAILGLRRRVQK